MYSLDLMYEDDLYFGQSGRRVPEGPDGARRTIT